MTDAEHDATLSIRERAFVEHYMGDCLANGSKAAKAAGYKGDAQAIGVTAHRLLKRAKIQDAIRRREQASPAVASRLERQTFWTASMYNTEATLADRLRASELLGKSQADFIEVRVAPVVMDPHASMETLIKEVQSLLDLADERAAIAAGTPLVALVRPQRQLTAAVKSVKSVKSVKRKRRHD